MPSKQGLIQDENHPVRCAECNVAYHLHYDSEAEASATFCSILADEIVRTSGPQQQCCAGSSPFGPGTGTEGQGGMVYPDSPRGSPEEEAGRSLGSLNPGRASF
jgi:hypothetical protein